MALPLILGAAPAVLGGLASIWAQGKAGKEMQKSSRKYELNMENLLDEQQGNLDKYVKPDMYANFLQSEQGASTLEAVRRQLQKQAETIRGGVSSTGATPEAQIAATSASSDQYADIVNRLYGQGTQYRQQARSQYLQGAQNLLQNRMGYQGNLLNMGAQRAQNWSQVGSNLAQVGAGLSTALFSGDNLSYLEQLFNKGAAPATT